MKIHFGQIYIQAGVSFPFTIEFQQKLSSEISGLVERSDHFEETYGSDWSLIFRISAKAEIEEAEIKGPTKYKKDKDLEYSIFLPFRSIQRSNDQIRNALEWIIDSVTLILESLNMDTTSISEGRLNLIAKIASDPKMIKSNNTEPVVPYNSGQSLHD